MTIWGLIWIVLKQLITDLKAHRRTACLYRVQSKVHPNDLMTRHLLVLVYLEEYNNMQEGFLLWEILSIEIRTDFERGQSFYCKHLEIFAKL